MKRWIAVFLLFALLLPLLSCGGEPVPAAGPEPVSEPIPTAEPEPEPIPEPEPVSEPEPVPEPEPEPEEAVPFEDFEEDEDDGLTREPAAPEAEKGESVLSFVQQDYFYDADVSVELNVPEGWTAYYTMNGDRPDEKGTPYTEPIRLKLSPLLTTQPYCICAMAQNAEGEWSEEIVHSYFLGKDVDKRFDLLVVSLSVSQKDLYDAKTGIFRNYNKSGSEWERDVHVEILEPDGTCILSQDAGIRVHGGASRSKAVKSVRLYARSEYDEENNWFAYPFFEDAYSADGTPITRYKRLVLRQGGNDFNRAFFRNELAQSLARDAGYPDTEQSRPVAVFLNGVYQAMYFLEDYYNTDYYFQERCGDFEGTFEISKCKEAKTESHEGKVENLDFLDLAALDLTDDANYARVCAELDVEQYLFYMAVNLLLDNEDWPQNNMVKYRYVPAEGESYGEAPFDGKWRFVTHDMDMVLGIQGLHTTRNSLEEALDPDAVKHHSATLDIYPYCPLFAALMEREDCRQCFAAKAQSLWNGALSQANITAKIGEWEKLTANELSYYFRDSQFKEKKTLKTFQNELDLMRDTAAKLASRLRGSISLLWGYRDQHVVTVTAGKTSAVSVDGLVLHDGESVPVLADVPITLTPVLGADERFAYWMLDGRVETSETVTVPPRKEKQPLRVELVTEEAARPPRLTVSAFSAQGDEDFIVLRNPTVIPIRLEDYTLSDGGTDEPVGSGVLKPGEEKKLFCSKYSGADAADAPRLSFSLKRGEQIVLKWRKDTVETVSVPDMPENAVLQRNPETGKFREILK